MHTNVSGIFSLSKPVKLSSTKALVISLALSLLKLKNIIESFAFTNAIGLSFSTITVGLINSSNSSL